MPEIIENLKTLVLLHRFKKIANVLLTHKPCFKITHATGQKEARELK